VTILEESESAIRTSTARTQRTKLRLIEPAQQAETQARSHDRGERHENLERGLQGHELLFVDIVPDDEWDEQWPHAPDQASQPCRRPFFESGLAGPGQESGDRPRSRKEVEHQGDVITHEIVRRLNTTFITPIDRQDVHDPVWSR
jgi:hypothetical protein